jgi:uncharacterized protein YacL
MPRRAYLLVTAVIFSLIALLHLVRIIIGWSVMLASWSVPMWLSWVALIVTGALAYFGFSLATQSSRKRLLQLRRVAVAIARTGNCQASA